MGRLLSIPNNIVAFDCESTGLNGYGDYKFLPVRGYPARPFEFSFCDDEGNTADIRFSVDPKSRKVLYTSQELKNIRDILEDPKITKVGFNLSFDVRMSGFIGIKVLGNYEDAMYLAHVFTGGDEMKYDLKGLCKKMLDYSDDDEQDLKKSAQKERLQGKKLGWCLAQKDLHGREPVKADYWMADKVLCSKYAVQDAERTMLLFQSLWNSVKNNPDLVNVYRQEMKLLKVVSDMENIGTRVFTQDLKNLRKFYEEYRDKHKLIAEKNGGKDLNFRSPTQMIKMFIDKKGYKPLSWTKDDNGNNRNPQVNSDFLKHLADNKGDVLAKAILESRGADHMITGFLDPYERFKVQESKNCWALHPNYRQCGPVTGRFGCGDPNLMNVADQESGRRKTDITLRPREALGPRDGYIWYLPDYSQIEVWLFSFLAQDKIMMDICLSGRDFHGELAKQIWGQEENFDENYTSIRKRAKNIMFCKLYGGGAKKIALMTESTVEEAYDFIDNFNMRLPGSSVFMNQMINKAGREGKIQNPFGRYYYIKSNFAYKAVNYLVQGSAADILKRSMIRIHGLFKDRWVGCHLLLTLHDELVIEVPLKYHSKRLMREIITEMQRDSHLVNVPIPLPVGMKIAPKRWSHTIEIESLKTEWKEKYLCKATS